MTRASSPIGLCLLTTLVLATLGACAGTSGSPPLRLPEGSRVALATYAVSSLLRVCAPHYSGEVRCVQVPLTFAPNLKIDSYLRVGAERAEDALGSRWQMIKMDTFVSELSYQHLQAQDSALLLLPRHHSGYGVRVFGDVRVHFGRVEHTVPQEVARELAEALGADFVVFVVIEWGLDYNSMARIMYGSSLVELTVHDREGRRVVTKRESHTAFRLYPRTNYAAHHGEEHVIGWMRASELALARLFD